MGSWEVWGQLSILIRSQVFQRREDGSVNFFRGWEAYRDGFGKLTGEHWLGETPARRLAHPLPVQCTLSHMGPLLMWMPARSP